MSEDNLAAPAVDSPDQADETNVMGMHEPILREQDDPRDGLEPIPPWMSLLFGALLFYGGFYMATYSGGFRGDVYDERRGSTGGPPAAKPAELPLAELGKRTFVNCQACHQATGQGVPGQYPPLAGSEWVDGPKASPARLTRILLLGAQGRMDVKGATYNNQMPAWKDTLKDRQIAAVLTYIRQEWGNKAPEVTEAQVAAARKALAGRGISFTAADLEGIPLDFSDVPGAAPAPMPPGKAAEK